MPGKLRVALLEPPEVLLRIVEPVGVVDAQPVDLAGRRELKHEAVRRLENVLVLHAQRGEIVDVEEAPVVDFVGCHTPRREPISLPLEERVKALEARAISGMAVELVAPPARWRVRSRHECGREPCEMPLVHVLVALTFEARARRTSSSRSGRFAKALQRLANSAAVSAAMLDACSASERALQHERDTRAGRSENDGRSTRR